MPGNIHEWRTLAGYSPWGRKESDTTERLHFLSENVSTHTYSTESIIPSSQLPLAAVQAAFLFLGPETCPENDRKHAPKSTLRKESHEPGLRYPGVLSGLVIPGRAVSGNLVSRWSGSLPSQPKPTKPRPPVRREGGSPRGRGVVEACLRKAAVHGPRPLRDARVDPGASSLPPLPPSRPFRQARGHAQPRLPPAIAGAGAGAVT